MGTAAIEMKEVSRFISRGLNIVGKNAYVTWACRNQAQIRDYLSSCRSDLTQVTAGGTAEGTTAFGSDVDTMQVHSNIVVLTNATGDTDETKFMSSTNNQFVADFSDSNPGYAKLIPVHPKNMQHYFYESFQEMFEELDGKPYLSSEKFVSYTLTKIKPPTPSLAQYSYRHGPCLSVKHQNIYGLHMQAPGKVLESDVAFALACDDWPEEAKEWITRERENNWPEPQLVEKIKTQPCHIVPTGDQMSEFCSLEWRLSFLLGERELMWSFNDTQIQCYVILKRLVKRHIDSVIPDQISSYHLKTIMFWLAEQHGISDWTEENLLDCVHRCLSHLEDCVRKRELQHYFHRRNNLFRHKLMSSDERNFVLHRLKEIKDEIVVKILNDGIPDTSTVYRIWITCRLNLTSLVQLCRRHPEISVHYGLVKKVNDVRRHFFTIFNLFQQTTDFADSLNVLQQMSVEMGDRLPGSVDQTYRNFTKLFLAIRIGITQYCLSREAANETEIMKRKEQSKLSLQSGVEFDSFSGRLYLAMYHFSNKEYQEAANVATRVISIPRHLLYTGHCSMYSGLSVSVSEAQTVEQTADVPITGDKDETICPVFDMLFSRYDLSFVPEPLKYECGTLPDYGERVFMLHPCAYAFTILFLSHFYANDKESATKFLERLEEFVEGAGDSPQKFRALNLLGYCSSLEEGSGTTFRKALSCYQKSLQQTANMPKVQNAAAYHVGIIILKALGRL